MLVMATVLDSSVTKLLKQYNVNTPTMAKNGGKRLKNDAIASN